MTNSISDFFNKFSKSYDESIFNYSLGTKYLSDIETDFVLTNCPIKGGENVLDIGIGTGRFSYLLSKKGAVIYGIDISEEMIKKAKEKLKGKKVNYLLHDVSKGLTFLDNTFDYVICIKVLKYLYEWKNVIEEITRILKYGGILFLEISNLYSLAYFGSKGTKFFCFRPNEIKKELENNKFEIIKIGAGSRFPFPFYKRINNKYILLFPKVFEGLLDRIFPPEFLSRSMILICRKRKYL